MTKIDLEFEISPEILEQAVKDVMRWARNPKPGPTAVAEATGFSRQMLYRAKDPGWDPPVSSIIKLAYAKRQLTETEG